MSWGGRAARAGTCGGLGRGVAPMRFRGSLAKPAAPKRFLCSVFWLEVVLAYAAQGAYPVFRQVFKRCSWCDAAFWIANCGVVYVAAGLTYILLHNHLFLSLLVMSLGVACLALAGGRAVVAVVQGLFLGHDEGHSLHDLLRRDVLHARIVAPGARLVAVDAARAAGQVYLHGVVGGLVPAHEACRGVCGSPHADHRCSRY